MSRLIRARRYGSASAINRIACSSFANNRPVESLSERTTTAIPKTLRCGDMTSQSRKTRRKTSALHLSTIRRPTRLMSHPESSTRHLRSNELPQRSFWSALPQVEQSQPHAQERDGYNDESTISHPRGGKHLKRHQHQQCGNADGPQPRATRPGCPFSTSSKKHPSQQKQAG